MNNTESERLTRLETKIEIIDKCTCELQKDVKKMMTNDFPHLRLLINEKISKLQSNFIVRLDKFDRRIDKIDKKVGILWLKMSIIIGIFVAIVQFAMARIFK